MGLFNLSSSTEHYAPHKNASFEGWYSKFRLPSGGSIALIISSVPGAAGKAGAVGSSGEVYKGETDHDS